MLSFMKRIRIQILPPLSITIELLKKKSLEYGKKKKHINTLHSFKELAQYDDLTLMIL